jgi:enamine deaminase RidA (YjgF/YER057c/UK114 family)
MSCDFEVSLMQIAWQGSVPSAMPLYPGTPYEYTASADGFVFTAGACPLDPEGRVVAPGDLEAQAAQTVENLLEALAEAGARPDDLLKTTIYVVGEERADLVRVWDVVSARLGRTPSTLLGVSLLGYPDQLVEIEAVAARRAGVGSI